MAKYLVLMLAKRYQLTNTHYLKHYFKSQYINVSAERDDIYESVEYLFTYEEYVSKL